MRAVCVSLVMLAGVSGALAQAAPDPAFAPAKARFEALALAERQAIQRDLGWVASFAGAASGEFGPLTFAALRRFEAANKSSADAILEPAERAALAKAAEAARATVGFRIESDKASGMRIGVPTKLLTKRSAGAGGHERWQDANDKVTLDFVSGKPEETLESAFARGTEARAPGRTITYKLMKPDFFVISGETSGGKFYRRLEKLPDGRLLGFSIGYDKALAKTLDPLVIAMAATFEARPGAKPPAGSTSTTTTTSSTVTPVIAAPPKTRRISAVLVAPGKVLTALKPARACKALRLDGAGRETLTIEREDAGRGLAVLAGARSGAKPLALAAAPASAGLLLQRDGDGKLTAGPATIEGAKVLAPLQEGGAGAAILTPDGALAGLVSAEPASKYAFNGTLPALRYTLVPASEIGAFLGAAAEAKPSPASLSAGEVAAQAGSGILSILCE